jgi:hypothetical protein
MNMDEPDTRARDSELPKRGGLSYVLASILVFGLILLLGLAVAMAYDIGPSFPEVP